MVGAGWRWTARTTPRHGHSWSPATTRWLPRSTATDTGDYPVRQHGPRRLWDEIVAAHHWWEQHDSPQYTEFGLTVTAHGQHPWLSDPTHHIHRSVPTRASS
jgi:hypothetical protein